MLNINKSGRYENLNRNERSSRRFWKNRRDSTSNSTLISGAICKYK
jgi:hypothetical protein